MTRAQALVDLAAVRHNLGVVQDVVGSVPVMAVVKADGYGHGLVPLAREARAIGIEWLGVALPSEARALREAGDGGRILTWLWAPGEEHLRNILATQVDVGVASPEALAEVGEAAYRAGVTARVHLKIDTGLCRNGVLPSAWVQVLREAHEMQQQGRIDVVGCWSHLANADIPGDPSITRQRAIFDEACALAHRAGFDLRWRHLANSAAALSEPGLHYDLVRVGIAMYGVWPFATSAAYPATTFGLRPAMTLGLRPAMTLTARLASVKTIPAGESVSYGGTWTATEPTRVGLVPVGYADGVPRSASNAGRFVINGHEVPIVGRVAMDQCVVSLAGIEGPVAAGDEVIVFGVGGRSADDLAQDSGTIGYEIVTRIGSRVPRVYQGAS